MIVFELQWREDYSTYGRKAWPVPMCFLCLLFLRSGEGVSLGLGDRLRPEWFSLFLGLGERTGLLDRLRE